MKQQHRQHGEEVARQIGDGAKTLGGKQLNQQCEYAVGGNQHEDFHHFHHDGFHIPEKARDTPAALPRMGDGVADQQGEHDDLQHLALGHRLHGVGRDDVHQHIGQRRLWRGGVRDRRYQIDTGTGANQEGEQQCDGNGQRRGGEVQAERLYCNRPHPGAVSE